MPILAFLVSFLTCVFATTVPGNRWDDLLVKHSWLEVPDGWEFHSYPSQNRVIDLRIGLKEDGLDDLVTALYEVSDPTHSKYGKHLSKREVDSLVAPHPSTVDAVESWLRSHNIKPADYTFRSTAGEWIGARVSIAQAERMLGNKYGIYHHPRSSDYVVRSLNYSLPRELHDHINVVTPTTYFGTMKSMKATSFLQPDIRPIKNASEVASVGPAALVPSSCATVITPDCLRGLYNTLSYVPTASNLNSLGVAGYLNEFANQADLQTFFRAFRTDAVGTTFTIVQVNGGGNNQGLPGVEANLDIQYAEAISFPTPNIYYSTGGSPPFLPDSSTPTNTNEPYLDWLNFVLNQHTIPQTFTTSYGDDEQTVPPDYANAVCNQFLQLGALGSTVLFSSGDVGVGAGSCKTNDGRNQTIFQPIFPATCPYVTAVGGTRGINPEVAAPFSSGGFSRYWTRPVYQNAPISTYLAGIGTLNSGLYNPTGRGFPDVAAQASGFQVVVGGRLVSVGGTSASSPTVAGIIALLNDYRLTNCKPPLGFLNPLLYQNASALFNDITAGSNPGCGTNGFPARAGWDPVTGLGTPDFIKLQSIILNVPSSPICIFASAEAEPSLENQLLSRTNSSSPGA